MFCKNCGAEISQEANFCKNCGNTTDVANGLGEESKEKYPALTSEEISKYKGLEGWLTLVGLGLFVTTGYGIYIFLDTVFNNSGYAETAVFKYDLINGGLMAVLGGYVLYLYFKRKKNFKKFYIILWLYMVIQGIVTYAIASSYTSDASALNEYINIISRNCVGAIIWGSYVVKSKRVKATFTED